MNQDPPGGGAGLSPFLTLRGFARPRSNIEQCELCGAALAPEHAHLIELASHRLACSCDPCAILFSDRSGTKYRRVPRRVRYLPEFRLTDEAWEDLQLPINLAFFMRSTPAGRVVALYPSPAGATEALVTPESWQALVAENPVLGDFEPDVEGLLVNRVAEARDCYRVGIDECYRLVGLIRTHWRGLSGGAEVWGQIAQFFADLRSRS